MDHFLVYLLVKLIFYQKIDILCKIQQISHLLKFLVLMNYLNINCYFLHRRKQDEVQVLEQSIRQRNEQHKKAGAELDATCHLCLKTKFADGVGHVCQYCHIRCCARCGGKVTLRSNKV